MKDPNRQGMKLIAAFFLVFILGFSTMNLVLQGPALWTEIRKIDWSLNDSKQNLNDVEASIHETMLLRYPMIDAYGALQMAMGKHESNAFETIQDKNGFLYAGNFWIGFGDDTRELAIRTKHLQQQVEAQGGAFGTVVFPMNRLEEDAAYYGLPYNDFSGQAEQFCAWTDRYGIPLLDLQDNWKSAGLTQEEAFFKTDHHWTPLAAFWGYREMLHWLADEFDESIPQMDSFCAPKNYEHVDCGKVMNGSFGRKAGLLFTGGMESYTVIYPKKPGNYHLEVDEAEYEGTFQEALLRLDYTVDDYSDRYQGEAERTYLHSSVAKWMSIENRNPTLNRKILLLRDSYATPIGAFLAQTFQNVDLMWIKMYTEEELNTILREGQYDYVILALYPEDLSQPFFPFGGEGDKHA